jgi:hypothetical protein
MNITALLDKFAAITGDQEKELADAVEGKDMAAVEAFCRKHGIEMAAEERNAMAEFFKTGKLLLFCPHLWMLKKAQRTCSWRWQPPQGFRPLNTGRGARGEGAAAPTGA